MPSLANQPKVTNDRGKNLTREDRQRGGRASAAKARRNEHGHFMSTKSSGSGSVARADV